MWFYLCAFADPHAQSGGNILLPNMRSDLLCLFWSLWSRQIPIYKAENTQYQRYIML